MTDDKKQCESEDAGDAAALGENHSPRRLPPLRSVHTPSFAAILEEFEISLVVSTYQAGKLVFLRSADGQLNTHFCGFPQPMGVAVDGDRLAIGVGMHIREFHNLPAVAAKLQAAAPCDACFLPRRSHVTGEIQIHEMEFGREGLWFVNTRFSCLCTLDDVHSFVPRWRPAFISALAPEDRCHLNGMCLVRGEPRFVTALGETDTPAGWRANKKNGGILIDVANDEVLVRGLSMPHSPRWHAGRLWVLQSGMGGFGYIDQKTLEYVSVAELPGFTRGLDFCGPLAFIGLSQVRETAVFSGIPITERDIKRRSGVWIVNIDTSQTVGYLEFEDAVQELFAVAVLRNLRRPDLVDVPHPLNADSFELPDLALEFVPEQMRVRSTNYGSADRIPLSAPPFDIGPEVSAAEFRTDSQLSRLATRHSWPFVRPNVAPREREGWLSKPTSELLASVLTPQTRLVLELGSWLGLSTRFIADRAPNAVIIAIDHWQGSEEHRQNPDFKELLPVLYETFLSSCWDYRERIIPMRMNSTNALEAIALQHLAPDVIYLDADHSYEAVKADIVRIRELFPDAILIGDDWDWVGVRRAASEAAIEFGATIGVHGCAWRFCDAGTSWKLGAKA
jgi:uncharacterized protein (TIGR03032 family)